MTPRQLEVTRLFALGRTWEEVMHETGCSRVTVHKHRSGAMAAEDVGSMPELWAKIGWLTVPELRTSGQDPRVSIGASAPASSLRRAVA